MVTVAAAAALAGCGSTHAARSDAGGGGGGATGAGGSATPAPDGGGAGGGTDAQQIDAGGDASEARDASVGGDASDAGQVEDATPATCTGALCSDFPATPIFDGVPSSVASMFSGDPPIGSGGACITEPQDGTMFPNNWLRPRVKFANASGQLAQIRMSAPNQANTLVAYTASDAFALPADIWATLRLHQVDDPVTVTVWVQGGAASSVRFTTAPVAASGSIVFFSDDPTMRIASPLDCYTDLSLCDGAWALRGFSVGDASTVPVLAVSQVAQPSRRQDTGDPAPVTCVGCHAATPDSAYVSAVDHYAWRAAVAAVSPPSPGAQWATLTPGGLEALQQPGWGRFSYTKSGGAMDYWRPGLRIGVASLGELDPTRADWGDSADQNDSPKLAWINIEAPNQHVKLASDPANWAFVSYAPNAGVSSGNALGFLSRTGDTLGAATPSWSHDGTTVAYASTNASVSGRLNIEAVNVNTMATNPLLRGTQQASNAARAPGLTDIYTVPFNGGLGGVATPVPGASTTDFEEYYPAYSPDDRLIAFTRVPAGQVMFANPYAEIALVRASGGPATPLAANVPPACSGRVSPGVKNIWAMWSPTRPRSATRSTTGWCSRRPAATPRP
jgi:hypothetical protein